MCGEKLLQPIRDQDISRNGYFDHLFLCNCFACPAQIVLGSILQGKGKQLLRYYAVLQMDCFPVSV